MRLLQDYDSVRDGFAAAAVSLFADLPFMALFPAGSRMKAQQREAEAKLAPPAGASALAARRRGAAVIAATAAGRLTPRLSSG